MGIDLGTTYSLVGAMQAGRPVLFPDPLAELLVPSAVSIDDDGSMLVGAAAKARAVTHPELTATCFKRDMGTPRLVPLGRRKERPESLSAAVLATLKANAEAALGCAVEEAVVTVPAYFGDLQRQATRDAGAIAGLRVDRIVNEPTAAALAYGLHRLDDELRAVVLDLGGGTFDVTVLEIAEGVIEVQSSAGDTRLGGEDFDEALLGHVRRKLERVMGELPADDPRAVARLRAACERAKRRLSDDPTAAIVVPRLRFADGRERDVELEIERDGAEAAWRPVLEKLRAPVRKALADAGVAARELDEVLVVGGATRMPAVIVEFSRLLGRMPRHELPPDEAVALGAAIQGGLKSGDEAVADLVVTDVAPFSLGVATAATIAGRTVDNLFSPVLERGTVIPASRVETFHPMSERQREVELPIYQGEHSTCDANSFLGRLQMRVPRDREGDRGIDVRFTYDLNGLLEVEATVRATGARASVAIEQRPGALSESEVAQARAAMQQIKFHPRDALPNRTALARADAAYQELTGGEREVLGEAIAAMRAELDGQDAQRIAEVREQLNALLAHLR